MEKIEKKKNNWKEGEKTRSLGSIPWGAAGAGVRAAPPAVVAGPENAAAEFAAAAVAASSTVETGNTDNWWMLPSSKVDTV